MIILGCFLRHDTTGPQVFEANKHYKAKLPWQVPMGGLNSNSLDTERFRTSVGNLMFIARLINRKKGTLILSSIAAFCGSGV